MGFCILEKDKKTFEFLKRYILTLNQNQQTCHQLDNHIQAEEIKKHLITNGYTDKNQAEILKWIKNNSQNFRDYLNSIKIAYLVCTCMDRDWNQLTWEDFCLLQDRINAQKAMILDTIF